MKRFLFSLGFLLYASMTWAQYCTSGLYGSGCAFGDDLDGITLGTFTTSGTGCNSSSYIDSTAAVIDLTHSNVPYTFTATTNYTSQSEWVAVWIDYNDDNDFDDAGEHILSSTTQIGGSSPTYTGSILVDNTAPLGQHRIRVRLKWGGTAIQATESCTNFSYGETHDYTVNVKANIVGACTFFSNFLVDSITGTGARVTWTPGASNNSYFFEYGATGFTPGTGTMVTGTYPGTSKEILSSLAPSTTYDYYFGEICNAGADTSVLASVQSFTTTAACSDPLNFALGYVSATEVELTWTTLGNPIYKAIYDTLGFNPAVSGALATFSTNPDTITALTPGTEYEVYLYADCGVNGSSDTLGPLYFKTPCLPFTAPDSNNFDSETVGAAPGCWEPGFVGAGGFQEAGVSTFGNPRSAPNHVRMRNSNNNDTTMLISPEYSDLSAGDKQVSFYAYGTSGTSLIVGTIPNQTSFGQFHSIDTIQLTGSHTEYLVYLDSASGYNGTDGHIAFLQSPSPNFATIYIDDYNYEVQPPCPKPVLAGISATTVGDTFATITVNSSVGLYDYWWGPTGFQPGSPSTGLKTGGSPFTIDSLLVPGGTYDVYVRSNCDTNGISVFTGPITFTTNCLVQTLPYFENFNVGMGCFSAVDGGSSNHTWNWYPKGGNPGNPGDLDSTGLVQVDSDDAGGGNYLREYLEGPVIDASGLTGALVLEFDQYYNSSNDSAIVEVFDGSNWVRVLVQTSNVGGFGNPDHQYINVDAYANAAFQVRFLYDDNNNWAWYWLIDNVSIREVTCSPSTALMGDFVGPDTAAFSWTPGNATSFVGEYGPAGFTHGSGTSFSTTDTTLGINGLSAQTMYEIYIVDSCASGLSDTLGPISFQTSCLVQTLPYTEDFNVDLGCMTPVDGGTHSATWEHQPAGGLATPGDIDGTGYAGVDSDEYGASDHMIEMLVSPPIDAGSLPMTSALILDFDQYYRNIGNDSASVQVFDGSNWITIATFHQTIGAFGAGDHQQFDVTAYANANFQVRFHYDDANLYAWYWLIDNLSVTESLCGIASNPDTLGVGVDTARLTWTSNGTNWNINWGPAGFFQGSGNGNFVLAANSNPYTLSSLTKNTCYDYYVQDTCIGIGSGPWVGPFSFCTKPSCPAPANIQSSAITATSATINWNASGLGGDFIIEYGPVGFVLGTGTVQTSTATSIVLNTLIGSTSYDVYVQDSCGLGDVSTITGPHTFTTSCIAVAAPYFTDLSAATVGHWDSLDACWNIVSNNPGTSSNGGYSWEIRNTTQTTSFGTGPLGDNTIYPSIGGTFVTADVSGSGNGDSTMFISPEVDLTGTTAPELKYYYHMFGGSEMADLHVDIYNGTSWVRDVHVLTGTYQTSSGDAYIDTTADLSAYIGQTVRVRFRGISGGCCAGDIALDDISIAEAGASPCPAPTNVTATAIACDSIEVKWNTAADTAVIAYGPTGGVPSTLMTVVGDSVVYITGTMANTSYDVYVGNICGTDTSAPAGPITVNTGNAGAPVAAFTNSIAGFNVNFDATTSTGMGNTYTWDFGDGNTGTGDTTTHTYATGGNMTVKLVVSNNCGSDTVTMTLNGISLEEIALGASLAIFPNPATDLVNFELDLETQESVTVKLISISGQLISSQSYGSTDSVKGQLDVSSLANGVYMIKIETEKGTINQRLIKE